MLIRNEQESFDTDDLVFIDRQANGDVVVALGRYITFKGLAAQQVWSQVTEQAETISELNNKAEK